MNRKFKLSGLLIFLALSLSLMTGLVLNLNDFIQGFKGGIETPQDQGIRISLLLSPKHQYTNNVFGAELLNQKDSLSYSLKPAIIEANTFIHETTKSGANIKLIGKYALIQIISGLVAVCLYLLAIIYFFQFILAVHKGRLFERRNLKLLNRLGVCLIATFFLELIFFYIDHSLANQLFSFEDYSISFRANISFIQLISGLSALLVSQILAIGKEMKDEQELTI